MSRVFVRRAIVAALLAFALTSFVFSPVVQAQPPAAAPAEAQGSVVHLLGVAIGLGMIVIGAGRGTLPLFLLEGVAVIAEVFILLVVFQ